MRDICVQNSFNGERPELPKTYDLSRACYRLADFLIASVPRARALSPPLVFRANRLTDLSFCFHSNKLLISKQRHFVRSKREIPTH